MRTLNEFFPNLFAAIVHLASVNRFGMNFSAKSKPVRPSTVSSLNPGFFEGDGLYGPHNFYFALIELKIWNYKLYRILVACVLDAFLILSFS